MKEFSQKQISKDCVLMSITAMLNVRLCDTLELMSNLDNRILSGVTSLKDCSFQVINGYSLYRKYVSLLDYDQHKKRAAFFKNVL